MAIQSNTLAWKILWREEPGRLKSMGSLRVRHNWATSLSLFTFMHWRRKWQPIPVFLPGESQGQRSLVGCHLWGRTEPDWSDLAAAAAANIEKSVRIFTVMTFFFFLSLNGFIFRQPTWHIFSKTMSLLQINQRSKKMKSSRWHQSHLSKSWCCVDEKQWPASFDDRWLIQSNCQLC